MDLGVLQGPGDGKHLLGGSRFLNLEEIASLQPKTQTEGRYLCVIWHGPSDALNPGPKRRHLLEAVQISGWQLETRRIPPTREQLLIKRYRRAEQSDDPGIGTLKDRRDQVVVPGSVNPNRHGMNKVQIAHNVAEQRNAGAG